MNYPKVHGGPERAVSLFSLEVIRRLQDEGHPIYPGATGENLTVAGLDWAALAAGTQPGKPKRHTHAVAPRTTAANSTAAIIISFAVLRRGRNGARRSIGE